MLDQSLCIVQAYRKLALKKHPDRRPNDPNASKEFIELQRAYDILSDSKAREAWTALQRSVILHHTCTPAEHIFAGFKAGSELLHLQVHTRP